jgi:microcompartment protein CcmK/EutM
VAEPLGDQRVVPGDDAGAAVGELADLVEGGVHVREAGHDRERPVPLQLLEVVQRVGGQDNRPADRAAPG